MRAKLDPRPDIVMVMTDQHAARCLGAAGDPLLPTPAIDRLASQGVRFENCYCSSPLCVPSRMAFLTGLEPHQSGVLTNDDYLSSDVPTIAHAMGAAGYECHLVGRMHFYGPDQHHGFSARPIGDIGPSYPGSGAPDIGALTKGRGNRGPELEYSGAGETSYQAFDLAVAEEAERTISDLLRRREATGRPFFALVSLFCPHPPFIARRDDYDRFAGRVPPPHLPPPEADHPALKAWREAGGVGAVSAEAVERSRTAYYGLVSMIDRIVDRVDRLVADRDNTVTIYTSDHGECLGERGLWWKSVMYDQSAKVPLVIRAPDMATGMVDERVTSLMDLSATLTGWSGAAALPGHTGHDLRNVAGWRNRTTSSYYGGLMNISLPPLRHRMLRDGRHKLVWYDGEAPQLFDLEEDPEELDNLAPDPAYSEVVAALFEELSAGWDPSRIAMEQARTRQRTAIIRDWVRQTRPPEPQRWVDPSPERNRYE